MGYKKPKSALEEFQPEQTILLEDYLPFMGREKLDELRRLADSMHRASMAHVSSTFQGGGVAEMLRSLVPMGRSLGIETRWFTLQGNSDFFKVTRKMHDMLQGRTLPLSLDELFEDYLGAIEENAGNTRIVSDLVVMHDPQPAALINKASILGKVLWQCHLDTTKPDPMIWNFLLPYINQYSSAIFSMPQYVGQGVRIPAFQVMPGIDPLAVKNRQYTDEEALEVLAPLFNQHDVDPGRPIIAAVSRYDVHKNQANILKAFKRLKKRFAMVPEPYLIFLGDTAPDAPESEAVLKQLQLLACDDPDVRFLANVEDNDRVVGALMRRAEAVVHVSTRESFGLVVSEALWQGTPVIGSRVGGIAEQVIHGQTGVLVNPKDVDSLTARMAGMLLFPEEAKILGQRGREFVRKNYLLPEVMRRYLILMLHYKGLDRSTPSFRINSSSEKEISNRQTARRTRGKYPAARERVSY